MAALRRAVKLKPLTKPAFALCRPISTCKVLAAEWNYKWPSGKKPETPEEAEAASKKYGIIPSDYKPLVSDQGQSFGDYPDMPLVGEAQKDPFHNWDDPVYKRDFHEPVHVAYEILSADKGDPGREFKDSPATKMKCFFGAVALLTFLVLSTMQYSLGIRKYDTWTPYVTEGHLSLNCATRNWKPGETQLPSYERNVHYTFEPAQ